MRMDVRIADAVWPKEQSGGFHRVKEARQNKLLKLQWDELRWLV